jgi:hypothetical protein
LAYAEEGYFAAEPEEGKRAVSPAALQCQIETIALAHAEGDISTETLSTRTEDLFAHVDGKKEVVAITPTTPLLAILSSNSGQWVPTK